MKTTYGLLQAILILIDIPLTAHILHKTQLQGLTLFELILLVADSVNILQTSFWKSFENKCSDYLSKWI